MSRNNFDDKSKYVRMERQTLDEVSRFLMALGQQFTTVNNAEGAFDCYKYALDLNPKLHAAVFNLGVLYNLKHDFQSSYRMFKEASRMNPDHLASRVAVAEIARRLNKFDESLQILNQAMLEFPEESFVLEEAAVLDYDLGKLDESLKLTEKIILKNPGNTKAILNRALLNMSMGDWSGGWSDYELCLSYGEKKNMGSLKIADAWKGEPLHGKRLAVVSDQGFGDAIQFSRYFPDIKKMGEFDQIIFVVQSDLKDIVSRFPGVDLVVGRGEDVQIEYDAFSSLVGVMRILNITPENCWRQPHVKTLPVLDDIWKARITSEWDGHSVKVGLVWAGDPKHGNDHARSIPLGKLLQFESIPNLQIFSFQVGQNSVSELEKITFTGSSTIIDLGSQFRSFDDTASALKQMDFLISVDTSVLHLAGCMGIEAWGLIPNPSEWRWLLTGDKALWYDNVKLYRETVPRDWDPILEIVGLDLRERCSI